jgi:hypothetical protein
MSRSPYYPRKRSRVLTTEQKQTAKKTSASGPTGNVPCALCHAYVPCELWCGILYVQAPAFCLSAATYTEVCPWVGGVAHGANRQGDATLSSDRIRAEVHPA